MIRSLFYMSPAPLPGINLFNLTGRTALITGGSKGLGFAMAAGLACAGADVMLVSRQLDEAQAAAAFALADNAQGPTEASPLLVGDWPDVTICKDGADYYMTHSSGPNRPAVLNWHSRDLQTWTPLVHARQRHRIFSFLPLSALATLKSLVIAFLALCPLLSAFSAEKPNIIHIMADELGYYEPAFSGKNIRTPSLDRLAAEGMKHRTHSPVTSHRR